MPRFSTPNLNAPMRATAGLLYTDENPLLSREQAEQQRQARRADLVYDPLDNMSAVAMNDMDTGTDVSSSFTPDAGGAALMGFGVPGGTGIQGGGGFGLPGVGWASGPQSGSGGDGVGSVGGGGGDGGGGDEETPDQPPRERPQVIIPEFPTPEKAETEETQQQPVQADAVETEGQEEPQQPVQQTQEDGTADAQVGTEEEGQVVKTESRKVGDPAKYPGSDDPNSPNYGRTDSSVAAFNSWIESGADPTKISPDIYEQLDASQRLAYATRLATYASSPGLPAIQQKLLTDTAGAIFVDVATRRADALEANVQKINANIAAQVVEIQRASASAEAAESLAKAEESKSNAELNRVTSEKLKSSYGAGLQKEMNKVTEDLVMRGGDIDAYVTAMYMLENPPASTTDPKKAGETQSTTQAMGEDTTLRPDMPESDRIRLQRKGRAALAMYAILQSEQFRNNSTGAVSRDPETGEPTEVGGRAGDTFAELNMSFDTIVGGYVKDGLVKENFAEITRKLSQDYGMPLLKYAPQIALQNNEKMLSALAPDQREIVSQQIVDDAREDAIAIYDMIRAKVLDTAATMGGGTQQSPFPDQRTGWGWKDVLNYGGNSPFNTAPQNGGW